MVLASVELSGATPATILNLTRGYVIEVDEDGRQGGNRAPLRLNDGLIGSIHMDLGYHRIPILVGL